MEKLYEIKEKLCEKLEEYKDKEITAASLEVIDKLAHAIKNIDKIIENYDEYSEMSYRGRSYRGGSYRGGRSRRSYDGGSYYDDGSYEKRDSMGRYSRHDMTDELRDLMKDAPDEHTKEEFRKFIKKIEMM